MEKNVLHDGNSSLGLMSSSLEIIYFIIYCFWMRLGTKVIILVFCPTVDDCLCAVLVDWAGECMELKIPADWVRIRYIFAYRKQGEREMLTICAPSNTWEL